MNSVGAMESSVGSIDGRVVGLALCAADGLADGARDGAMEGVEVTLTDGSDDELEVMVGNVEGTRDDGATVGVHGEADASEVVTGGVVVLLLGLVALVVAALPVALLLLLLLLFLSDARFLFVTRVVTIATIMSPTKSTNTHHHNHMIFFFFLESSESVFRSVSVLPGWFSHCGWRAAFVAGNVVSFESWWEERFCIIPILLLTLG